MTFKCKEIYRVNNSFCIHLECGWWVVDGGTITRDSSYYVDNYLDGLWTFICRSYQPDSIGEHSIFLGETHKSNPLTIFNSHRRSSLLEYLTVFGRTLTKDIEKIEKEIEQGWIKGKILKEYNVITGRSYWTDHLVFFYGFTEPSDIEEELLKTLSPKLPDGIPALVSDEYYTFDFVNPPLPSGILEIKSDTTPKSSLPGGVEKIGTDIIPEEQDKHWIGYPPATCTTSGLILDV